MKRIQIITFVTLICLGCSSSNDNGQIGYRNDLTASDINGNPASKESFYFDPAAFRDTFPKTTWNVEPPFDTIEDINKVPKDKIKGEFVMKIDSFSLKWFSEVLADNHEPMLSNYYLGKNIYRLTWLRSFHQSVVIRIINDKNENTIETKWLNWTGRKYNVSKEIITADVVSELQDMLKRFNFYSTESYDWEPPGVDGSEWILEAHTVDKYHFLNKWSPDLGRSNGLREIGEYIIKNSDAKNEEIY